MLVRKVGGHEHKLCKGEAGAAAEVGVSVLDRVAAYRNQQWCEAVQQCVPGEDFLKKKEVRKTCNSELGTKSVERLYRA